MVARNSGRDAIQLLARVGIATVVWFAAVAFSNYHLDAHEHGPAARAALAAIGIAGFLPWVYVAAKAILAQDEFTQRMHLVAIAFAFAFTAMLSLACDFLAKARFIPEPPFTAAWMVMGLVWWLSIVATSRYYR